MENKKKKNENIKDWDNNFWDKNSEKYSNKGKSVSGDSVKRLKNSKENKFGQATTSKSSSVKSFSKNEEAKKEFRKAVSSSSYGEVKDKKKNDYKKDTKTNDYKKESGKNAVTNTVSKYISANKATSFWDDDDSLLFPTKTTTTGKAIKPKVDTGFRSRNDKSKVAGHGTEKTENRSNYNKDSYGKREKKNSGKEGKFSKNDRFEGKGKFSKNDRFEGEGKFSRNDRFESSEENSKKERVSKELGNRKDGKGGENKGPKKKRPTKNVIGEPCIYRNQCGGCAYQHLEYEKQLFIKKDELTKLLKEFCKVKDMIGMEHPYHYRNKVHSVISHTRQGLFSGIYKAGSHDVIAVENCLIEDKKAGEIVKSVTKLMKSFKMTAYSEDSGYGLVRHILYKRGFETNQVMVVIVTASSIFPSKNNFVKALLKEHPEITTVVHNINEKQTSMVLGEQERVLYGKGYIEDTLMGCTFRISSKSFYQINPKQTEVLYSKAIELAGLTGKETLIDAYCGIGTIGLIASPHVKEVIGVELNKDAVKDANANTKINDIKNATFYQADAGDFMRQLASQGKKVDVVMMDPPRSGSTEVFMDSVEILGPKKVVYVSCNPETLARDLAYFKKKGYKAQNAYGVDMFPWTSHVEAVVLLEKGR